MNTITLAKDLLATETIDDVTTALTQHDVVLKTKKTVDMVSELIDDALAQSDNDTSLMIGYLAGKIDTLVKDQSKKKVDDNVEFFLIKKDVEAGHITFSEFTASKPGTGRTIIGENGEKIRKKTNSEQYVSRTEPKELVEAINETVSEHIGRINSMIGSLDTFIETVNTTANLPVTYNFAGSLVEVDGISKETIDTSNLTL